MIIKNFLERTFGDSPIRAIGLAENSDSKTAVAVQEQAASRLPFTIAAINCDNGGENEKDRD